MNSSGISFMKELDIVAKPKQKASKFRSEIIIRTLDNRDSIHAIHDFLQQLQWIRLQKPGIQRGDPVLLIFRLR